MATKKPVPYTAIAGVVQEDDHLLAVYKWQMFRYLFDNGKTVDVLAVKDDSDLRMWLLNVTGYPGIVGVAILEDDGERT